MKELFDLTGRVAVVTGGTGILGGAMVDALIGVGAKVAVLGRRKERANEVVAKLRTNGGSAMALTADVLNKESLETAKNKLLSHWGTIDILINAAGGNIPGAVVNPDQSILDLDEDELRKVIDLNQLGTILPSIVFAEPMIERKKGVIVNISSMAAKSAITRVLGYSTAKAGVDNFTQWLAVEMAQKYGEGIRVNAIAPGFFISEQNGSMLLKKDGSLTPRSEKIIAHTPMSRFGEPQELIGTLIWLCSDASRFVTGIVVPVDGGFSAFSGV
jgi:NAD(P)-dependent dehydrogenase (short-subunit alcohol dehydrogenase family)